MTSTSKGSVENWLDPDKLRPNLIAVSLYISAFELLKASIIGRLKSFFTTPGSSNPDAEYAADVLNRNRSVTHASLSWLREAKVIDDADIARFEKIRELRNTLAHALTGLLIEGLPADFAPTFAEMVSLLAKIERWWIINVDMATDPAFDGTEIDENEVMPGPVIALTAMMEVALAPDSDAKKYIDEFNKLKTKMPR